ncbi:UNVERIFIED_CONTAM: hypothetical protein K2H54_074243 [Gekko kuhli]
MSNRKRQRSASEADSLKVGKQQKKQKIDKFISNSQPGDISLTNRYAALESDSLVLPDKIKDTDIKVNAVKEVVNNLAAAHRITRAGDKSRTERTTTRNSTVCNLEPEKAVRGTSKSLADKLREADYPLAPHPSTSASNGTLMGLEESTPPPTAPAPTKLGLEPGCSRKSSLTPSAQDGPEDPLLLLPHVNGNLDNSMEDTLLLSFGTLSAQEQLDIIERLEITKNRLLSLRRNNPHGPPCDQTGLQNSSDADREDTRPFPSTQDMLDSRPPLGPNNEILAATDVPEVAARISGSPQVLRNGSVLVDWEQSLNQITELD